MAKKKRVEESYQLTFKGLVALRMDMDEGKTQHFLDSLEIFLRRRNHNAVILDERTGDFLTAKVYLEEK